MGHPKLHRIAALILLAGMALAAVPPPGAIAGSPTPPCLVRNVTQDTRDDSFRRMVARAADGDRLRVRGSCTSSGVRIDKDLVIRGIGQRAALQGRPGRRRRVLMVARGASVDLRDLIVEGGRLGFFSELGGAGILNLGRLTLRRVVVQGNGGREISGLGISNWGTLTLRRSVVRRNRGRDSDSTIYNQGTLILRHSQVRDNGQDGIYNHGVARLVDSVVARHRSGGIYNDGSMTLIRSTIRANRAGGIANWSTLTVIDSVIRDNRVDGDGEGGGGIWSLGTLTVIGSVIRDNTAEAGGGISNSGTLVVRDSVIRDNRAEGRGGGGGGLWNDVEGERPTAVVEGSRIVDNESDDLGGGIWNTAELTLLDTVVRGNRARAGGGIHNGGSDYYPAGTLVVDGDSSVTGNHPDDCVDTSAC